MFHQKYLHNFQYLLAYRSKEIPELGHYMALRRQRGRLLQLLKLRKNAPGFQSPISPKKFPNSGMAFSDHKEWEVNNNNKESFLLGIHSTSLPATAPSTNGLEQKNKIFWNESF
ncbi:hypothetical protein JTE90_029558 [Oedothorax gibbosus]|uniref:Uncharacterized protein n=1 Tax=Oedothorax gibbosus TaxID=931172 RepID=A0AAV6VCV8_9ARAC|nr:hypothetical protein JTE90_029558 [Oedothorax gibbosus]